MITRPLPDKAKQHLEASNKTKRTKRPLTHIGVNVNSLGEEKWISLAESQKYWIDKYGNKFDKVYGHLTGQDFPRNKILLDTIHSPT